MKIRIWIKEESGIILDPKLDKRVDFDREYSGRMFVAADNIFSPVLKMIKEDQVYSILVEIDYESLLEFGFRDLGGCEVFVEHLRFSKEARNVTQDGFFSRVYLDCPDVAKMKEGISLISTIPFSKREDKKV